MRVELLRYCWGSTDGGKWSAFDLQRMMSRKCR